MSAKPTDEHTAAVLAARVDQLPVALLAGLREPAIVLLVAVARYGPVEPASLYAHRYSDEAICKALEELVGLGAVERDELGRYVAGPAARRS